VLHSEYELEDRARQLRSERLQEAENERLASKMKQIEEPVKYKHRGLSSKLFDRRALRTPPLESMQR
jgi:hypothetical protein